MRSLLNPTYRNDRARECSASDDESVKPTTGEHYGGRFMPQVGTRCGAGAERDTKMVQTVVPKWIIVVPRWCNYYVKLIAGDVSAAAQASEPPHKHPFESPSYFMHFLPSWSTMTRLSCAPDLGRKVEMTTKSRRTRRE
jgi:hypothetical protein